MADPRRLIIAWEYLCEGIEWVATKEEWEAPLPQRFALEKVQRPGKPPIPRPWPERLSKQLLRDLKAWNDSWGSYGAPDLEAARVLQERGRELAVRVQNELGTDGWEVLYSLGGRVHRVHPAGSWPARTWMQDLLGYTHLDPREIAEEEARVLQWLRDTQPQTGEDGSTLIDP
jgi:hypothetical protein